LVVEASGEMRGHDSAGCAIVLSMRRCCTQPSARVSLPCLPRRLEHARPPASVSATEFELTDLYQDTATPANGTITRIVDNPGRPEQLGFDKETARALFGEVGLGRTQNILSPAAIRSCIASSRSDYGVALKGEIVLLLDDEAVPLNAGDAIVRRGTIHSGAPRRAADALARRGPTESSNRASRASMPSTTRTSRPC
jgi:hypothetical protein